MNQYIKLRLLLLTLFCSIVGMASAQNWIFIKNSSDYLYGEGYGNSIAEADKHALENLISKIAVNITATTNSADTSEIVNGKEVINSQFTTSVNTYSNATLTNTQMVIISNEPDAHVGRYILKSEINKIFSSRIAKIKDMVQMAEKAELKGKADDALRNYYWALTLLKSLQRPNEVVYDDETGNKRVLVAWIPQKMNEIFNDLRVSVAKRDGNMVELAILFRGKPVNSVDYTYFDGMTWSNIYSAKDGVGVIELLPNNNSQTFQLKYEFEYRGQAQIDNELETVMNVVSSTPMRKAYVSVPAQVKANTALNAQTATFTTTNQAIFKTPKLLDNAAAYSTIMNKVIQAVTTKNTAGIRSYFTDEGWNVYTRLVGYGNARIVGQPNLKFFENEDFVIGRGVQMSFSFKTGSRKSFVEDVVFTFNNQQKICNLAFGLGNTAIDDILNKGVWSEQARLGIMSFLENYKTAYCLKRLDYITSVFDDDAVIIVGHVAKVTRTELNPSNQIIKKNRYTKDQYLRNLERCFAANEFINIRFANNDVYKLAQGGELYAIQIAQDYYSSNYGDKGYLFLMVDINDPQNPIIKVRTWQPDKDPDFGLYGPGDF